MEADEGDAGMPRCSTCTAASFAANSMTGPLPVTSTFDPGSSTAMRASGARCTV